MLIVHGITWSIAALATSGVIIRPWRLPEAIWAVLGAATLIGLGLLPWTAALVAINKGTDVYLFLTGMMLLAELARREGLFEWLAAIAVRGANGSARRLFALVYGVGTVVTVFLSNDATAVVLTPAVYAVTKAARAEPLPYLLVCAFVANAASFVLPISNPANLVIFGSHMPPPASWLAQFALPSVLSIVATYVVLYLTQAPQLRASVAKDLPVPRLSSGGRTTRTASAARRSCCSWPLPSTHDSVSLPAWQVAPQPRSSCCASASHHGSSSSASRGACCRSWRASSCSSRASSTRKCFVH